MHERNVRERDIGWRFPTQDARIKQGDFTRRSCHDDPGPLGRTRGSTSLRRGSEERLTAQR